MSKKDLSKKNWDTIWEEEVKIASKVFESEPIREYEIGQEVWHKRLSRTMGKHVYEPVKILTKGVFPNNYMIEFGDGDIRVVTGDHLVPVEIKE